MADTSITEKSLRYVFPQWIEEVLHVDSVYARCLQWGLSNDSDDIASLLTEKLTEAKKRGKEITRSYAWRALLNTAADHGRQYSTHKTAIENYGQNELLLEDETSKRHKQEIFTEAHYQLTREAIELLDDRPKFIIKMRFNPEYQHTYANIAGILNCSESTARIECDNALAGIKAYIMRNTDAHGERIKA
jgi:DNA-directed RNA polymerase specialized sigma24 family protein